MTGQRRTYNNSIQASARRRGRQKHYTPGRKLWTSASLPLSAVVYHYPHGLDDDGEDGAEVSLYMSVMKSKYPMRWILTKLRPDELEVLRQVVAEAFDIAKPICEAQHAERLAALNRGETPHLSFYRDTPSIVRADSINPDIARQAHDAQEEEGSGA